jgi:phosphoribosylaminoimidazole-succinocarboxamide synthase
MDRQRGTGNDGATLAEQPLLTLDLPGVRRIASGKVREIFPIGQDLLLVATDRVSAFDVVMKEGIAGKGNVLTEVSAFWFRHLAEVVPNHFVSADADSFAELPPASRALIRGRAMRCLRAQPMPVEWVVRGYLTGSGFKDYQHNRTVSGITLPPGLQHASELEPPILTPSTKASSGHDVPISFAEAGSMVGQKLAEQAREAALELYRRGNNHARERGIVIADTKFEFGLREGRLMLIDECLTPDSSRFWPADEVRPGARPRSFDKQVLRDWLEQSGWNKQPPPPALPREVVEETAATYRQIRQRLLS